MAFEIREAGAGDADAIAALHALSWRATYRGILPDSFLDHEAEAERRAVWSRFFVSPPLGGAAFVALDGNRTHQAFIAFERGDEPGYDAVIENLHVAPTAHGKGLGKSLLGRVAAHLIDSGFSSVCLRVYDSNVPAIAFYERLGGRIDGHGIDPFAGADAPDTRIGWHDLPVLRDRCLP